MSSRELSPVVTADRVTVTFEAKAQEPPVDVLRSISLSVYRGEMVSIVGPSGSGKSTLLYCLSGLMRPTSGTVLLMGSDTARIRRSALARLRREHVGFVFQQFNLVPSLTALENIVLPQRLGRRSVDHALVRRLMGDLGLDGRARHLPSELSGGQQQRVAIGRVLAAQPEVVFADEPTGSLDTKAGTVVLDMLRRMTSAGRAVVLVTHDLEAAARADRVLVLRDGQIHTELTGATPTAVLEAVERAGRTSISEQPS